jgi:flagellar biosynthetic protein FliR
VSWGIFDILLALPVFALVLFRIGGLVMTAPVFGSALMPVRIRVALTVALAAMIFPMVSGQGPSEVTLSMALVGGLGEVMVGATIGLALATLFSGVEVGGLMVAQQAGIALGQVFNPVQNRETNLVGQVYTIVLIVLFLMAGGHREMVASLLDTFKVIPMLSFRFDEPLLLLMAQMLASAFILAIRLAGPVVIALFLTSLCMGFLSRTMPQLNILSIGFPLRILVGLSVATLAIVAMQDVLLEAVWNGLDEIRATFGLGAAGT